MSVCEICQCKIPIKKKYGRIGVSYHPLYNVWRGIRRRCLHVGNKDYKNYGGRGILICDEWLKSSRSFINWALKNGWRKGLSIDRINNDGNYEPSNCRIVTNAENQKNKSNHRYLYLNGEKYIMSVLARKFGLDPVLLWYRVFTKKMSVEDAVLTPLSNIGRKKKITT